MLTVALSALPTLVFAQATTSESDEDTVKMEKFEVNEVPIEQQILPTSRPFSSVFGIDDSIVDVPRNVTIISRQQLSDISIESVLDFSKLTSSAFTTTNFGAPSNASIRGQSADVFTNGVRSRVTSNGNGLPMDFNSVESVNIVKGPATAVQGTSMYVGGYIDLVTKRPFFDAYKGSSSVTLGSYGVKKWSIDVGGPLSPKLAYRVSYSGEDSDGYYVDGHKRTHSLYGALTFRPTEHYELFLNAQGFWANYTENWGVNRVTQQLIDDGLYTTGININNAPAAPSDPQNSANVLGGGNVMAWGPTVKINRHSRLLKPGDHSVGREFNAEAIQTFTGNPDMTVKNTTFASYTARNTLSSYYYSEVIDPSMFAENRLEVIMKKDYATFNVGLDLRYQSTKAYDDYFYEPANVWDLTQDHAYINVYNSSDFYGRFVGQEIPGWPNRYATQGVINGDTNDSHAFTAGPFVQSTWKVSDQFSVVAGGRYDFLHATVTEPLAPFTGLTDSISVSIPSVNSSLIYKLSEDSSLYVTYNYSENTSGAVGNGGGITGWNSLDGGATYFLDKENFTQPSSLWEVGTKHALMGGKLFMNLALYKQERTAKTTSSTDIVKFDATGLEFEMNYQPNKNFYGTFSFAMTDATVTPGFQSDGGTPFLPTQGVDYVNTHRVSGLPKSQFNALVSYTFDNGFGFSLNTLVTSPINNNYAGTLVIPWQYSFDGSASYTVKNWNYRLSVTNLTNEENWSPPNAVYGNGSILALPGTQFQLSAKYSF